MRDVADRTGFDSHFPASLTGVAPQAAARRGARPSVVPYGVEWIVRGVMGSEAGVDALLASRAETPPGLDEAVARLAAELEEAAITVEFTDSDASVAALLRAGLLSRRRTVAIQTTRGVRQSLDALYEACRVRLHPRGGGALILCDPVEAQRPASVPDDLDGAAGWRELRRAALSDVRDLAAYLGVPILAPATPPEAMRYVNEALRLSRAAGSLVLLHLPPSLMGGGETESPTVDPADRPIPAHVTDPRGEEHGTPLQLEMRRRHIDRVLHMPLPGERVPLGFVTFGTAHATLRHALHTLGLTGRVPILKLGCANPFDPRSVEHLLTRCERVILMEGGRPFLEPAVLLLARELSSRGVAMAEVFGKRLPAVPGSMYPAGILPIDHEPHPSELIERLGDLLLTLRGAATGAGAVGEALRRSRDLAQASERASLEWPATAARAAAGESGEATLVERLVDEALHELRDELSRPTASRPAVTLAIDPLETAVPRPEPDRRQVVRMFRRRLPTLGRAAIAQAIRSRAPTTFLVLPDPSGVGGGLSASDADRFARSLIADREAGRTSVSTLDPTDARSFRDDLAREVLSPGVSIVVISPARPREPRNVAGDETEWSVRGFAPVEGVVRPTSPLAGLCYAWLVRRGWDDPALLNGLHGPRLVFPDPDDPLVTPLDGWDGFEEILVQRRQRPLGPAAPSSDVDLPDPIPEHREEAMWRTDICGHDTRRVEVVARAIENAGRRMGYRIQSLRGDGAAGRFVEIVFSRPRPGEAPLPITPRIPYGAADLVVALDYPSLVEAVDGAGRRVAAPERTSLVLNLSASMTSIETDDASGPSGPRVVVPGELNKLVAPHRRLVLRGEEICARALRSPRMVGPLLLGAAFQRGWLPVTGEALSHAVEAESDDPLGLGPAALRLGRSLARDPTAAGAGSAEDAPSPEALLRRHRQRMALRRRPRPALLADQFHRLGLGALDAITGLRRTDAGRLVERRFVARLIDCELWGGLRLAREYADLVTGAYAAERSVSHYPVTRLVVEELARALLVPDPPFVARTMLRRDRRRALERDMRVDRRLGDRVVLRVRGRTQTPWLRGLHGGGYWSASAGVLRWLTLVAPLRLLPWWHRRDREHREWVRALTRRCIAEMPARSSLWLEIFRQLTRVRGHGVRRDARLRRVRSGVQALLDLAGPLAPAMPDTPVVPAESAARATSGDKVRLPSETVAS